MSLAYIVTYFVECFAIFKASSIILFIRCVYSYTAVKIRHAHSHAWDIALVTNYSLIPRPNGYYTIY